MTNRARRNQQRLRAQRAAARRLALVVRIVNCTIANVLVERAGDLLKVMVQPGSKDPGSG